jgi:hypothetical protein
MPRAEPPRRLLVAAPNHRVFADYCLEHGIPRGQALPVLREADLRGIPFGSELMIATRPGLSLARGLPEAIRYMEQAGRLTLGKITTGGQGDHAVPADTG